MMRGDSATDGRTGPPRATGRAFAISLLFHLLLFSILEIGDRLDWWRTGPLAALVRSLQLDTEARREELARIREELEQRAPLIFVDVDPSQASLVPPTETPYYGAVSSQAANPDTSRDLDTPELDGTQDKVLKTADTERTVPVTPAQAAPAPPPLEPQPLEPAPVPDPTPTPEIAEASPEPEPEPGDLDLFRPRPEPVITPGLPRPLATAPPRPRTIEEARARLGLNPDSALVGQRSQQDGGVRRFSVQSSLDVQGTPLGDYDRKFVDAVQRCWFMLLEEQRYSLDRVGRVVIEFRLSKEGRISNMTVTDSNVGDIYTTICQLAIMKPSPYEKWPADVLRLVGSDYRDVRFTFHY